MTLSTPALAPSSPAAASRRRTRRIVLTGGPGAGKTAVLELVRRHFGERIAVLPEAASIVFGGGFPRGTSPSARGAAQRAIYHVQVELERLVIEQQPPPRVVLCDRGTLDGLAYWPGSPDAFLAEVGTSLGAELARYDAVIHLRTASPRGYRKEALRIESPVEAAAVDQRLLEVWAAHPRRSVIESTANFMEKVGRALTLIGAELAAEEEAEAPPSAPPQVPAELSQR